MQDMLIKTLAEVLDVNLSDYRHLSRDELLATLEDMQADDILSLA